VATESSTETTEIRIASAIYGLIVASSVLAAGASDEDIEHVALSVVTTLVIYWLAEKYSHLMAVQHVRGQPLRWAKVRHDLRNGWPLVSASFTPLIVVVVATISGVGVNEAQTLGLICATVLLFASGYVAGRRSGWTGIQRILGALIAAGFGLALIVLKSALH
jgi:hypothetical protein